MDSNRLDFEKDIFRMIHDLSKIVFNVKTDEDMKNIFAVDINEIKSAINKLADALPDYIFHPSYKAKLELIKTICARELIFFQVQEKNDPNYAFNLKNFIHIFARDIQNKI